MNEKLKLLLLGSGILASTSHASSEGKSVREEARETREDARQIREEARESRSFFRQLREYFRGNSGEHTHVSNCNSSCAVEQKESFVDEDDGSFDVNQMSNSGCRTSSSSEAHNSSCSVK
jgi:hypothetical protein